MQWLKDIVDGLSRRPAPLRILAVMTRDHDAEVLLRVAHNAQWHLEFARDYESALQLVKAEHYFAIFCDRNLSPTWRAHIVQLALSSPDSSIILTSRDNDDQLWQEVIRLGGYDVLTTPFQEDRVRRSIQFAVRKLSAVRSPLSAKRKASDG